MKINNKENDLFFYVYFIFNNKKRKKKTLNHPTILFDVSSMWFVIRERE